MAAIHHVRSNSFPSRPHPQAAPVEDQLACNVTKDALSQIIEGLNDINSILRRKQGDLSFEVKKYLASTKSLRKSLEKVMKSLKATEKHQCNNDETLSMFGEVEAVMISVFETLLPFIFWSKCSKRSLVTRLMNQRRVSCEGDSVSANEFVAVDYAFHLFVEKRSQQSLEIEDVQSLEMCTQDLEEGLDTLFKFLIRVRASVLNM